MSSLRERLTYLLAKIEATEGTDSSPAANADAVECVDVTLNPYQADLQENNVYKNALGHNTQLPTNVRAELTFSVNLAGSGTPGTAPAWGVLLRGCAMAQTIASGTSVTYKPRSTGHESLTIAVIMDGIQQKLTGARGTFSLALSPGGLPRITFTFTGIYNAPSAVSNPAVVLTDWKEPVAINKDNTILTLHGISIVASQVGVDIANAVEARDVPNGKDVLITNRAPVANFTFDATTIAVKDWLATVAAGTEAALAYQIGTVAGAIVEVDADKVSLNSPNYGAEGGRRSLSLAGRLIATNGNDELSIIAR